MSRDYESRRRSSTSGSSKMRMDTSVSQSRPHTETSSNKRKEIDSVMRKARESQSSYWNKKLLEAEERDPNRWRHSGYKELYVGGTNSGETSRSHPRSPKSPRPRSPHSPRARSPKSPRERTHTRTRPARSPSSGSTCSDRSCSVCSPRERRRVVPQSRSRSRSISPVRQRAHPKEIVASSSRAVVPRTKPRPPPPMPRPRTPPPEPLPPSKHQKEYKVLKEKESTRTRRKEKHQSSSRVPEDPRVSEPIPLMRKPVKIEKTHSSHSQTSTHIHPPPAESSCSEDSDTSSNVSQVGPPRMTLSERFGKMAQWSVDRRDMENMRITKDGENAMKVVIEGEERAARLGYDSPPPGHYPETLLAQGPRGLDCWDDVRVRYDYYKARGYLRDLTLDDYVKWEEWWYKYQEWLEAERYYEQWATSGGHRPGGGRKRRGRRNNVNH
ncbi:serine/arginine repetitive matrix protein 1 [Chelonus insularis]|uniref:serine/arginine repetitive matrix protein 1 n=1 Tax=Chelonus insularis TaxID=460826 RepID=UPI00158C210F|nr:serine/arginine repetitive matrix protein 1 [Chelonus insularis]XP_034940065.1 serine/arginine repetitive matrix protein 1 [Chelonus insularis]